jgi:hypothetical protein
LTNTVKEKFLNSCQNINNFRAAELNIPLSLCYLLQSATISLLKDLRLRYRPNNKWKQVGLTLKNAIVEKITKLNWRKPEVMDLSPDYIKSEVMYSLQVNDRNQGYVIDNLTVEQFGSVVDALNIAKTIQGSYNSRLNAIDEAEKIIEKQISISEDIKACNDRMLDTLEVLNVTPDEKMLYEWQVTNNVMLTEDEVKVERLKLKKVNLKLQKYRILDNVMQIRKRGFLLTMFAECQANLDTIKERNNLLPVLCQVEDLRGKIEPLSAHLKKKTLLAAGLIYDSNSTFETKAIRVADYKDIDECYDIDTKVNILSNNLINFKNVFINIMPNVGWINYVKTCWYYYACNKMGSRPKVNLRFVKHKFSKLLKWWICEKDNEYRAAQIAMFCQHAGETTFNQHQKLVFGFMSYACSTSFKLSQEESLSFDMWIIEKKYKMGIYKNLRTLNKPTFLSDSLITHYDIDIHNKWAEDYILRHKPDVEILSGALKKKSLVVVIFEGLLGWEGPYLESKCTYKNKKQSYYNEIIALGKNTRLPKTASETIFHKQVKKWKAQVLKNDLINFHLCDVQLNLRKLCEDIRLIRHELMPYRYTAGSLRKENAIVFAQSFYILKKMEEEFIILSCSLLSSMRKTYIEKTITLDAEIKMWEDEEYNLKSSEEKKRHIQSCMKINAMKLRLNELREETKEHSIVIKDLGATVKLSQLALEDAMNKRENAQFAAEDAEIQLNLNKEQCSKLRVSIFFTNELARNVRKVRSLIKDKNVRKRELLFCYEKHTLCQEALTYDFISPPQFGKIKMFDSCEKGDLDYMRIKVAACILFSDLRATTKVNNRMATFLYNSYNNNSINELLLIAIFNSVGRKFDLNPTPIYDMIINRRTKSVNQMIKEMNQTIKETATTTKKEETKKEAPKPKEVKRLLSPAEKRSQEILARLEAELAAKQEKEKTQAIRPTQIPVAVIGKKPEPRVMPLPTSIRQAKPTPAPKPVAETKPKAPMVVEKKGNVVEIKKATPQTVEQNVKASQAVMKDKFENRLILALNCQIRWPASENTVLREVQLMMKSHEYLNMPLAIEIAVKYYKKIRKYQPGTTEAAIKSFLTKD